MTVRERLHHLGLRRLTAILYSLTARGIESALLLKEKKAEIFVFLCNNKSWNTNKIRKHNINMLLNKQFSSLLLDATTI